MASPSAKRKHTWVSYNVDDYFNDHDFEDHMPEDDDSDAESDADGFVLGKSRKRKSPKNSKRSKKMKKSKREQKEKPFRFLDLPAELRDEIYDLALTDPDHGMALVSRTKAYRRTVARGVITSVGSNYYYGKKLSRHRWWSGPEESQIGKVGSAHRMLTPNLLAVNKQVHQEAIGILYGQDIILEDTTALHTFLTLIGSTNQALLARITIKGWAFSRGHRSNNFAGLSALTKCINLRSLFFDCSITYSPSPVGLARQLYRDGHYFFEAFGAAKGKKDAVIDILELSAHDLRPVSTDGFHHYDAPKEIDAESERQFKEELSTLLTRR